jgi:hypothetical protein
MANVPSISKQCPPQNSKILRSTRKCHMKLESNLGRRYCDSFRRSSMPDPTKHSIAMKQKKCTQSRKCAGRLQFFWAHFHNIPRHDGQLTYSSCQTHERASALYKQWWCIFQRICRDQCCHDRQQTNRTGNIPYRRLISRIFVNIWWFYWKRFLWNGLRHEFIPSNHEPQDRKACSPRREMERMTVVCDSQFKILFETNAEFTEKRMKKWNVNNTHEYKREWTIDDRSFIQDSHGMHKDLEKRKNLLWHRKMY